MNGFPAVVASFVDAKNQEAQVKPSVAREQQERVNVSGNAENRSPLLVS